MAAKNRDLHGSVPDASRIALVIIDMINDLEFDGGDRLLKPALRAARAIAALKRKARKHGIPVIYANDNFGRWRSDFRQTVAHCLDEDVRGRPLAELLLPEPQDYFVLKAKHSAFYWTTLELLLYYLKAERVVLTGITGDMCVLLTAADAFMRDLKIYTPADCIASISATENTNALQYMKRVLHADTRPSRELNLARLKRR
ncbi:MAG: isochorismatase family cysteine hydrolase [Pseudomonadota bacterium]